jgi:hypothetical protein
LALQEATLIAQGTPCIAEASGERSQMKESSHK